MVTIICTIIILLVNVLMFYFLKKDMFKATRELNSPFRKLEEITKSKTKEEIENEKSNRNFEELMNYDFDKARNYFRKQVE